MGTEVGHTATTGRATPQDFAEGRHERERLDGGHEGPPPQPQLLDELFEAVRRSTRKQVSAFVAQPSGLLGLGVVGHDTEGALVMELPVPPDQIPIEVATAIDTIRFFLDDQLNGERDRMRRLLA